MEQVLPPLPPSDIDGMMKSKTARDFWKGAEIVREFVRPDKKCKHEFEKVPSGVKCKKCHFGLVGFFEVHDSSLYIKGEKVNF